MPDQTAAEPLIRILPAYNRQAIAGDVSAAMVEEVRERARRLLKELDRFVEQPPNKQQMQEILYNHYTHTLQGEQTCT